MNKKFDEIDSILQDGITGENVFGGQSVPTMKAGQCTEICTEYCPFPATGTYMGNVDGTKGPDPIMPNPNPGDN